MSDEKKDPEIISEEESDDVLSDELETPDILPDEPDKDKKKSKAIRYAVKTESGWTPDVSAIDKMATFAGILGEVIIDLVLDGLGDYRVRTSDGWSEYKSGYNKKDTVGSDRPILAVELRDETVDMGVHIKGGEWLPVSNGMAGCMIPMDAIWFSKK